MTKVISLSDYKAQKEMHRQLLKGSPKPILFSEISGAIQSLAEKDQRLIYQNIRYYYYPDYLHCIKNQQLNVQDYSFIDYLRDELPIEETFSIRHGVDFSGIGQMNPLSKGDWENIADMIVRLSIGQYLSLPQWKKYPLELARQYQWDQVMIDLQ